MQNFAQRTAQKFLFEGSMFDLKKGEVGPLTTMRSSKNTEYVPVSRSLRRRNQEMGLLYKLSAIHNVNKSSIDMENVNYRKLA